MKWRAITKGWVLAALVALGGCASPASKPSTAPVAPNPRYSTSDTIAIDKTNPDGFPPVVARDQPSQRVGPGFDPDSTAILVTNEVRKELDPDARFSLGVDRLRRDQYRQLDNKRVLVVTSRLAIDSEGHHLLESLLPLRKPMVRQVVLFNDETPEPGRSPGLDRVIAGYSSVRVFERSPESLHLTDAMLENIDAMLVDLPLRGAGFYPEVNFLAAIIEDASVHNLPMLIADRPNPINGLISQGPLADSTNFGTAKSYFPSFLMPGLTTGELARFFNAKFGIGATIDVIELTGWNRRDGIVPMLADFHRLGVEPWRSLPEWELYYPWNPEDAQLRIMAALLPESAQAVAEPRANDRLGGIVLKTAPMSPADFCTALGKVETLECTADAGAGTVRLATPRLLEAPVTDALAVWAVLAKANPAILPAANEPGPFGASLVLQWIREGRDASAASKTWQNSEAFKETERIRLHAWLYR